jgi:hypothetical protein
VGYERTVSAFFYESFKKSVKAALSLQRYLTLVHRTVLALFSHTV